jgi:sec-independent protein translocase protein TatA
MCCTVMEEVVEFAAYNMNLILGQKSHEWKPLRIWVIVNIPVQRKRGLANYPMALDDPVVWVLIIAVVIFLFGSSKIPQFARAIGQARREFEQGWKGISNEIMTAPTAAPQPPRPQAVIPQPPPAPVVAAPQPIPASDPLVTACQNEGIDTSGKTREQLASELSWKLNKK